MIIVYSRAEMLGFYNRNPSDTTPVISINDVGYDSPVPKDHPNCLSLVFDDVTSYHTKHGLIHPYYKQQFLSRHPIYFTRVDALNVIKFIQESYEVEKSKVVPKLYIHCYQGKSRSIAVALYAELFSEFGDGLFLKSDKFRDSLCNSEVLKTLLIAHQIKEK